MYYIWHIYFTCFGHSASDLFVHMLRKFRIFSGHLPEHQGCFFFGYSGLSQDMYYSWHIYFGYFGHSAAHLFVHMLWKFCISSGHLPKHQGCCFFQMFRTLPGHVLQFANLFWIFQTFSSSFIFAHAPEVPHFFRTFARAPGMFFFGYSWHSQDMYYRWHIYFRYFRHSAAHLFVHMLWKFRIFSQHYLK